MDTANLGNLGDLIIWLVALGAASAAYGKFVGPYQVPLTQIVITTLALASRWRPLANLVVGIVLAVSAFSLAAYATGRWELVLPGIFAGILASIVAASTHDDAKPPPDPTPSDSMG